MVLLVVVAVFLLRGALFQPSQTEAFKIFPADGSLTHQQITEAAFLRKMAEVCRDVSAARGLDFTLPINNKLTATAVQRACSDSYSVLLKISTFSLAISQTSLSNAAVDKKQFSTAHHFDNEDFKNGRDLITRGIAAVKVSVKQGRYLSARSSLGATCHTLQDFYSHSNWVELGSSAPFSTLIQPKLPLNNLAGPNTKTCKSCVGKDCSDNILQEVLQQKTLTSGYFSLLLPIKPEGKCSHGGFFDRTSNSDPTGGINKDDISSSHGFLHQRAAEMAINATMELLEDIRLDTGNVAFLRLMGLSQISVLAIVFDNTSSMSNYIAEAKRVTFSIIDSRRGTSEEPSEYILVPFNDQGYGPLIKTENADAFKEQINSLSASGGSNPGMCLSGLLLTLTQAPPSSDIFVFTDSSVKDSELKSAVEAMTQSTKSTVTFLLTNSVSSRSQQNSSLSRTVSQSDIQLYRDLAHISGGQTIEVTNSTLSQAAAVIMDAITPGLVTVLYVERSPVIVENFSFVLDPSLSNVTVYVTGDSPVFTLYSPTGVSQSGSMADGPLGSILTVGNLKRLKISSVNQTGEWKISISSTSSFTLKVIGQSSLDVLVYFVEIIEGGHGDSWGQSFTRPFIGRNATLFVSVTGGNSITVTDVLLVEASGSDAVNGNIKAVGATDFLVNVDRIPKGAFVIQLKGLLNDSSTSRFQRQSPTQYKGSRITITAQSQSITQPGVPFSLNFTVTSNTTGGNYTIRARTDLGFGVSFPRSLNLEAGGSAQGNVTMIAPSNTESGTDVTLTIEAEAPGSTDLNYVTVKLTVSTANTIFRGFYSLSTCLSFSWFFVSHFV